MTGTALFFFILFGLSVFGTYLALRRNMARPRGVITLGAAASIISMTLVALGQGNFFLHALFVGVIVGGLFFGAAVLIANFFQANEIAAQQPPNPTQDA